MTEVTEKFFCARCGRSVEIECTNAGTIIYPEIHTRIVPCDKCLEQAEGNGYENCKQDAAGNGYKNGKQDAK